MNIKAMAANMNFASLGLGVALIYLASTGKVKNKYANTAMIAVGAGALVRQMPVVSNYI